MSPDMPPFDIKVKMSFSAHRSQAQLMKAYRPINAISAQ